jgi:acyl carrier protein
MLDEYGHLLRAGLTDPCVPADRLDLGAGRPALLHGPAGPSFALAGPDDVLWTHGTGPEQEPPAGTTVACAPLDIVLGWDQARHPDLRLVCTTDRPAPAALAERWPIGTALTVPTLPTVPTWVPAIVYLPASTDLARSGTADDLDRLPLGTPTPGYGAAVVDRHGVVVPAGVIGELVVFEQRYRPAAVPLGETAEPVEPVRTGIVARCDGGLLRYLGTGDAWARGPRIDAELLADTFRCDPAVHAAVAAVRPGDDGANLVAVWLAPTDDQRPVPSDAAGHRLAARLCATGVPVRVAVLPAGTPLDPAGLPLPAPAAPDGPASAMEAALARETFAPLLGLETVDPSASFFELGGSSLAATRLVHEVAERYGIELTVADLFRNPTVRALAALVERRRLLTLDDDAMYAMLESMSDDDVARLLAGDGQEH